MKKINIRIEEIFKSDREEDRMLILEEGLIKVLANNLCLDLELDKEQLSNTAGGR